MSTDEAINHLIVAANPWNIPALLAWAFIESNRGHEEAAAVQMILAALFAPKKGTQ